MTSLGPMSTVGSGFMGSAWRGVQMHFRVLSSMSQFHEFKIIGTVPATLVDSQSDHLVYAEGKKPKTKRQIRGVPHEHRQRVASGRIFHSIVTVWNYYFNN